MDNPSPAPPHVEYTDVLRVGTDKINALMDYTYGIVPGQVNGLLVNDKINPALLEGSTSAAEISVADANNNFSSTNVEGALDELATIVDSIVAGGGSGDVIGPESAQANRIATFLGNSGKVIQDSGISIAQIATAAQGARADSAVQPGDLSPAAFSGSYTDLTDKPVIPGASHSVTITGNQIRLVNDVSAPGNNKMYGTSPTGVRGWFDVPEGTGGGGGSSPFNLDGGSAGTVFIISDDIDGGNASSVF